MQKDENVFIKIQIDKDKSSGNFLLNINLNKESPNVTFDKDNLNWWPTEEEIDFLIETYKMVSGHKKLCRIIDKSKKDESSNEHTNLSNTRDSLDEDKFDDTKDEEDDSEKKIFVQADHNKIDEILAKKKGDFNDAFIVEADEKAIIEKVLKQKKKKSM